MSARKCQDLNSFSFYIALALNVPQEIKISRKSHPGIAARLHILRVSYKKTDIVHQVVPEGLISDMYMHASPDCTGGPTANRNSRIRRVRWQWPPPRKHNREASDPTAATYDRPLSRPLR